LAWNDPEGRCASGPFFQVGIDLLVDRVAAVGLLSLDQDQRAVAEHGVVAVEQEQLLLLQPGYTVEVARFGMS